MRYHDDLRRLRTLQSWSLALFRRVELDGLIADGAEWSSCRLCEARARQLVKAGRRAAVAAEIEACVELAGAGLLSDPSQISGWLVDLRVAQVGAAGRDLLELARALRSAERPKARGVAMAMLLVRHGQSPLYVGDGPNDIALAANAAQMALSGRDGPDP
jgi:hypothetical protein